MKNISDRLSAALFIFSIFVIAFFYGFIAHRNHIFPYQIIVSAKKKASVMIKDIRAELPWYYRKGDFDLNHTVLKYNPQLAYEGLNLVTSLGPDNELAAKLIDMQGKIIHRWDIDWFKLWPNPTHLSGDYLPKQKPGTHIHGVVLMPNGDLVFNFERCGLIRININSEVVWRLPYQTHHSVYLDDRGDFWVSGQKDHHEPLAQYPNYEPTFTEYTILRVSAEGKIIEERSVFDLLRDNGLSGLLYLATTENGTPVVSDDTLHLNDVEIFPGDMEEGFFKKGDIMISLRNINTVIVFGASDWKVKHLWSGQFVRQHDPDFVDGHTISVFDNNNIGPESSVNHSRIVVLTTEQLKPDVYFEGSEQMPFHTMILGKHQWLKNGNLLITESLTGRAFEVDRNGEIVWEYINVVEQGLAAIVDEVQRVPLSYLKTFEQHDMN